MQRRWKLDQYLSYLSAPPLPCCCSSQWSPERRRQATRSGWTDRQRGGDSHTDGFECGWCVWTHRRRDGPTTPSQEHKPARTPVSERQRAVTRAWVGQFNRSAKSLWSFPQENTEKNGWNLYFVYKKQNIFFLKNLRVYSWILKATIMTIYLLYKHNEISGFYSI